MELLLLTVPANNMVATVLLPIALSVIMFGLGTHLTWDDFLAVGRRPRAVLVGLLFQMILLPLAGFGIVLAFGMQGVAAVGVMLLAASPGGSTSNFLTKLAGGDVAYCVSLTTFNSLLTLVSMPLIVEFSLRYFMGAEQEVAVPFGEIVVKVFGITLVPVGLGMWFRSRFAKAANRSDRMLRILSLIFFVAIVAAAIAKDRERISGNFTSLAPVLIALNVCTMALGFAGGKLFRLGRPRSVALAIETGVHNGTMAITVALTVLKVDELATPAAIYSLLMFPTAIAFAVLMNRDGMMK